MCQLTETTSSLRRAMKRPRSAIVAADAIAIVKPTVTGSSIADTNTNRSHLVRFSDDDHTVIGRSDTTTPEYVRLAWYMPDELEVFRKQARDFILGRTKCNTTETTTRGYEKYSAMRSKRKAMVRKITLLACSQKGLKADEVRSICVRASADDVKDAFRAGCNDYCAVYCPEMVQKLQQQKCSSSKRSRDGHEEPQRNVRQRTVC